jgi:alpha,alpha-trehalase
LAPLTRSPQDALPTKELRNLLTALGTYPDRLLIAVASGRTLDDVSSLLAIDDGIAVIGTHGLEVLDWTGRRLLTASVVHCMPALERVRAWLNEFASCQDGFFIEDKRFAIALHYREASNASALIAIEGLQKFLRQQASELEILHGEAVAELIPRVASDKGFALLSLLRAKGEWRRYMPIYFSDDAGDEGAFFKVRRHGVTILVGPERASCAEFRVENRDHLTEVLIGVAQAIENEGPARMI